MRTQLLPILLLIAGVVPAAAAPTKDDGMKDYVIPVGWNALLNKENKTALIIGEFKQPSRGRGKVTPLNRGTESELMAAIKKLGYAVVRPPTPSQPPNNPKSVVRDQIIPLGWNALLNHDQKTALVIGEFKSEGKAHGTLEVLNRNTEAELMAEITKLNYVVTRPTPRPTGNNGVVRIEVIPIGWNALLHDERKTALVIGEYKSPGKSHGTARVLNRGSEAELMAEIAKLGYEVQRPPARQAQKNAPGGAKELVLPVGWNALLDMNERTADIIGEFKNEERIVSKLTLLNCGTEAELVGEINLMGFTIVVPSPNQKK